MLHKWTPWDKYFKYQNFLTHFPLSLFLCHYSFVIIPRMLWGNLMNIYQIYTPYKFAQSCCIPP